VSNPSTESASFEDDDIAVSETSRPWRGDKKAIAVLSFDVDAEAPILALGEQYADHPSVMSHQAYGPRVGVPRILELLADFQLKATFFIPGLIADRYPHTVEAIAAAGHEIAHHTYSHRSVVDMTESEERADFEGGLSALGRLGISPRGFRAAFWEASWRTTSLVAEYGLAYDSSLMDDDRPYLAETHKGTIVELCPHWSLDDWEQYAFLPRPVIGQVIESPRKALEVWTAELDGMRRHGCLFVLTCHPFLSGRPGRLEALRALIEHALRAGDVGFATAAEVADRARDDPQTPTRSTTQPASAAPD
jgi:peptidoglycan/xylan/chitin deacetylase (PgdA/CDA1 family)